MAVLAADKYFFRKPEMFLSNVIFLFRLGSLKFAFLQAKTSFELFYPSKLLKICFRYYFDIQFYVSRFETSPLTLNIHTESVLADGHITLTDTVLRWTVLLFQRQAPGV